MPNFHPKFPILKSMPLGYPIFTKIPDSQKYIVMLPNFHQKFLKTQGYAEALLKFGQLIRGSSDIQPKLCPFLTSNSNSNLDKVLLGFSEIYFLPTLNSRINTLGDYK